MPDFRLHAVSVPSPGAVDGQDTMVLGKFLRDVAKLNQDNLHIPFTLVTDSGILAL
jgi:phosphoketolase